MTHYIILDTFPTVWDSNIVTNEYGEVIVFDTEKEALEYSEEIQSPLIVAVKEEDIISTLIIEE